MSDFWVDPLTEKLEGLRVERATVAATRTKEDVRGLGEEWLASACRRMNGTVGLVLNGHANPEQVLSVIAEFLLDSPDLVAFITRKVEATAELSDKVKKQRLGKLDAEISKLEAEQLRHAKAAALAELEAKFAGVGEAA